MPIYAFLDFIGCRVTLMNADSAAHLLRRCELLVARQPDLRTVRGTRCDAWHPSNPTRHSTDEAQHERAACGGRRAMRHSHAARHVRVEEPPAAATAVVATLCDTLHSSSLRNVVQPVLAEPHGEYGVLCGYSVSTLRVLRVYCVSIAVQRAWQNHFGSSRPFSPLIAPATKITGGGRKP